MKRRWLCALLALALLLAVPGCPAAKAAVYANARTALYDASDNKINNIRLAVEAINGTYVRAGEAFSFNDVVGARTGARGYRSAPNGRGVNVTGGGVSQVASTLYMALLNVEGEIRFNSLSTYGNNYKGDHVSDGSLAVITDYSAGIDFRFTNYASDMRIEMWYNGDWLYCELTMEDGAGSGWSGESTWFDDWSGQTGSWFDDWSTPRPTAVPSRTQTVTARIPFDEYGETANNVRLAAGSVYDTTLAGDDVFSFNRIVGPRTEKYGYDMAVNGRGARVVGGGVAQVASVIWLAVKDMDDVAIIEKSTYGTRYNQDYVDRSSDAILTDYNADLDFSFRYTGSGAITIYTYVDGGSLCCDVVCNG